MTAPDPRVGEIEARLAAELRAAVAAAGGGGE